MAILVGDDGIDCDAVAGHLKNTTDKIPVVFLSARIGGLCNYADHNLMTGEPENLVNLVRSLVGVASRTHLLHLEHTDVPMVKLLDSPSSNLKSSHSMWFVGVFGLFQKGIR